MLIISKIHIKIYIIAAFYVNIIDSNGAIVMNGETMNKEGIDSASICPLDELLTKIGQNPIEFYTKIGGGSYFR